MSLRQLSTAPKVDDYTSLQEHQSQTPSTFFGSKPVLYAHYTNLTLSIPTEKLQADPATAAFSSTPDEQDSLIKDVEILVSSENVILFQKTPTPTGISIPYPSIALHATLKYRQTEALFINIYLTDLETVNEDEDIQNLEIYVLPPNYPSSPSSSSNNVSAIKEIFTAMNTCADLHPDPDDDSEDGGEVDDSAPGATGWITAENMEDFVDEEGNFRGMTVFGEEEGGEELGPGAGTVRARDDGDDADMGTNGVNGTDETKWQRTG